MMRSEQRIRAGLFYASVIVFVVGLPLILFSTLGYKFNRRSLAFTKTGLIGLKTQPSGASVYLDGKLLPVKTPATVNELLPGKYALTLQLEGHYPWSAEVEIQPSRVTRLEKVILFPVRPLVFQLNKERLSFFFIDEEKGSIYYISEEEGAVYTSDLDGEHFRKIAAFPRLAPGTLQWKLSPDREKALFFDARRFGVVYLQPQSASMPPSPAFFSAEPSDRIIEAFWHSDSYHLILVSKTAIEALEARVGAKPVTLAVLSKGEGPAHYDAKTDTLYFIDFQRAADGQSYKNLYRMELTFSPSLFSEIMKRKADE